MLYDMTKVWLVWDENDTTQEQQNKYILRAPKH